MLESRLRGLKVFGGAAEARVRKTMHGTKAWSRYIAAPINMTGEGEGYL
jgi:hypothetical protein